MQASRLYLLLWIVYIAAYAEYRAESTIHHLIRGANPPVSSGKSVDSIVSNREFQRKHDARLHSSSPFSGVSPDNVPGMHEKAVGIGSVSDVAVLARIRTINAMSNGRSHDHP